MLFLVCKPYDSANITNDDNANIFSMSNTFIAALQQSRKFRHGSALIYNFAYHALNCLSSKTALPSCIVGPLAAQ